MPDTRTQILDLAEELIRGRGYHAFSYKDISIQLGVKNAAIHYHFPSKADLGLAMIDRTRAVFKEKIEIWRNLDTDVQLEKFIETYKNSQKKNLVCFIGALGPSFDTLPENMKVSLSEASREIRDWVAEILETGSSNGYFKNLESIPRQTDMILSSLLASLILNKVTGEDILGDVKSGWETHLKESSN